MPTEKGNGNGADSKKSLKLDWFALKIAFFNCISYTLSVGLINWIDPKTTTHVTWGARYYPLGYWVLALSPVVFFGTYSGISRFTPLRLKYLFAWFPLALATVWVMPNFYPEVPHGNLNVWMTLTCAISFVTTWVHFREIDTSFAHNNQIHVVARIERLKEWITFWRVLSIAAIGGYAALLIPWFDILWSYPQKVVKDPGEANLILYGGSIQLGLLSIYMFVGPILEMISKTLAVANALLKVDASSQNCPDN